MPELGPGAMWPLGHCSPDVSLALHSGMWGKTGHSSAAKQKQTWGQAGGHVSDLSAGQCLRPPWLVALGGISATSGSLAAEGGTAPMDGSFCLSHLRHCG